MGAGAGAGAGVGVGEGEGARSAARLGPVPVLAHRVARPGRGSGAPAGEVHSATTRTVGRPDGAACLLFAPPTGPSADVTSRYYERISASSRLGTPRPLRPRARRSVLPSHCFRVDPSRPPDRDPPSGFPTKIPIPWGRPRRGSALGATASACSYIDAARSKTHAARGSTKCRVSTRSPASAHKTCRSDAAARDVTFEVPRSAERLLDVEVGSVVYSPKPLSFLCSPSLVIPSALAATVLLFLCSRSASMRSHLSS